MAEVAVETDVNALAVGPRPRISAVDIAVSRPAHRLRRQSNGHFSALLKYTNAGDGIGIRNPYAHPQARLYLTAFPLRRPCVVSSSQFPVPSSQLRTLEDAAYVA